MLAIFAIGSTAWAGAALGANPVQLLDRVEVVSPTAVLDMSFQDPGQTPQFDYPPGATGGNLSACQLTGTDGLFCLDQFNGKPGRLVRNWNPVTAGSDRPLFSCEDSALVTLGFDTSKSTETCTGLTVGSDSAVFVAGKKKSSYSLIKVVPGNNDGSCNIASPWTGGQLKDEPAQQYCWKQLSGWRDRPVLLDITATSLVLVNTSGKRVECSGVLGLEERKTLMFFPDPDINDPALNCGTTPVVIATSKQWGLTGSQQLQSASILRMSEDDPTTTTTLETSTYALATTNGGLVKAKDTSVASALAFMVFDVPAERSRRTVPFLERQCDFNPQNYGVRTSTKSKRVYVSDRNFCEVMALQPIDAGDLTQRLGNVTDGIVDLTLTTWLCPYPGDSTCTDPTKYYAPLEPTTAPGESIDLSQCGTGETCTLTTRSTDPTYGTSLLSNVTLSSSQTGLTLFQVQNIPDCRWINDTLGTSALPDICLKGAIVDANGNALVGTDSVAGGRGNAAAQFLDVSKLLPKEVTDQFRNNPLQPMYLQPKYRAQNHPIAPDPSPHYYFDAFFGIPETGVQFRGSFDLELFVKDLSASREELGCPRDPWGLSVAQLLNWDLTVRISEKYLTVGGPTDLSRTGILSNSGCGSTKNSGGGFSIYAYNLEYARPDGAPDQRIFANQVVALFSDLYKAQHNTAMKDVDGNCGQPIGTVGTCGREPIPASVAVSLDNSLANASDKLSKCLAASNYPKQSEALRNCQSFDSQMTNYLSTLDGIPACGTSQPCDVANRRGELRTRVLTLRHVFDDRFLPSVPTDGFNPPYGGTLPLPFPPP